MQPLDHELASVSPVISFSLLHDIILLEVCAYSMKNVAKLKREAHTKTEEINELIENKIDCKYPDHIEVVNKLKEDLQEMEDERDTTASRKYFAKIQMEGDKPSKLFCNLNKKRLEKAQFEELQNVKKKQNGEEEIRVVTKQK